MTGSQPFKRQAGARIPTAVGELQLILYRAEGRPEEHLALVMGEPAGQEALLVRVHSECFTGDVLGSLRCDCGEQLQHALSAIAAEGAGVVVYLRQEGRGIGLLDKLRAYNLQDQGLDTVEANEKLGFPPDKRDYGIGAQILRDLGLRRLEILTNNPKKVHRLSLYGIEIVKQVPIKIPPNEVNRRYLQTKKEKMGHLLD